MKYYHTVKTVHTKYKNLSKALFPSLIQIKVMEMKFKTYIK